jgi:DNA-binding Xre family transcriptional regulator
MTIVNIKNSLYANHIVKVVKLLISYRPFWETLKKKNVTTYTLINKYNISSATIDRMKKGNGISTMKIDDFCRILECGVSDIIEYIDEK